MDGCVSSRSCNNWNICVVLQRCTSLCRYFLHRWTRRRLVALLLPLDFFSAASSPRPPQFLSLEPFVVSDTHFLLGSAVVEIVTSLQALCACSFQQLKESVDIVRKKTSVVGAAFRFAGQTLIARSGFDAAAFLRLFFFPADCNQQSQTLLAVSFLLVFVRAFHLLLF